MGQPIDVLVVGAGPTGLTLACELLRMHLRCRIIDKLPGPNEASRALGLQPRTMELFQIRGIIKRFLPAGIDAPGATIYRGRQILLRLKPLQVASPYPNGLLIRQNSVEHVLRSWLEELGGVVEYSRELVDLTQDEEYAIAMVRRTNDEPITVDRIHARWLVGCDGARSRVRDLLGVRFEGEASREDFLVADVDLDWQHSRDDIHAWLHSDGVFAAMPLPYSSQWRLFANVGAVSGRDPAQPSLSVLQSLLLKRTGYLPRVLSRPSWTSRFRVQSRMVDRYRHGRVFLAGDAAHIHSPFGGQGMNCGIQDAINLGWKLAHVVHGRASLGLLDSYEGERLPVARNVLGKTLAITRVIGGSTLPLRLVRDQTVVRFLHVGHVQSWLGKASSQLYVHYRTSSLSSGYDAGLRPNVAPGNGLVSVFHRVVTYRNAPQPGDRAPEGSGADPSSGAAKRLFGQFGVGLWTMLLFEGMDAVVDRMANLNPIARLASDRLGNLLHVCLIVSRAQRARGVEPGDGSPILDPAHTLHQLYGATTSSLYLVRPDGYIAFRSRPALQETLRLYLDRMFPALEYGSQNTNAASAR